MKAINLKIGIVVSKFNEVVTSNLLNGAKEALRQQGLPEKNIKVFYAPGAFEIPLILKKLCKKKGKDRFSGLIALGCVIKGETAHFEYISNEVSHSIAQLNLEYEIPVAFGVLTCYTPEQAFARCEMEPCNEDTNKGYESGLAVMEMIKLLRTF
ncbi:MAG: 6,7-dimethyl-8-ribityllumazine synthase [Ignavibacteriae bacterium]|nr:6,7-dimethyl-8-ribityllumazine synthase [Ignavibacteriota bacterium]